MEFPTYGTRLRIKVDSQNDINLHFDIGWGAGSLHGCTSTSVKRSEHHFVPGIIAQQRHRMAM